VKQHFSSFIREVFDNLSEYVITPELMLDKQREEMENSK
jgi:WD40 repeat protein